MKKLINFLISAAIGVIVLYMISVVLACIVLVFVIIVNRIIAYRKKHRRFTDWEYQYSRVSREIINQQVQLKRITTYQRFDRVLNQEEIREDVKITPIKNNDNFKAEEFAEWLAFRTVHQQYINQEVRNQMSGL